MTNLTNQSFKIIRKSIFLWATILIFQACEQPGIILNQPRPIFKHNGKTYKALKVTTGEGNAIWVVISDSVDAPVISIHERIDKSKANDVIVVDP
jgi:hypothetical protein